MLRHNVRRDGLLLLRAGALAAFISVVPLFFAILKMLYVPHPSGLSVHFEYRIDAFVAAVYYHVPFVKQTWAYLPAFPFTGLRDVVGWIGIAAMLFGGLLVCAQGYRLLQELKDSDLRVFRRRLDEELM